MHVGHRQYIKKTKDKTDYQAKVEALIDDVLMLHDDFQQSYGQLDDEQKNLLKTTAAKNWKSLAADLVSDGEIAKAIKAELRAYVVDGNKEVLNKKWQTAINPVAERLAQQPHRKKEISHQWGSRV